MKLSAREEIALLSPWFGRPLGYRTHRSPAWTPRTKRNPATVKAENRRRNKAARSARRANR